ncbi:MAG: hypothetical protein IKZ62_06935 [Prevotella sp.]|nr:hypothetical protein [Prevotella sp.]
MKKVLFSFAVAVLAATMVSCGNKTAQNAEGQDSAAAEEQTEQKAEEPQQEVKIEDQTEISSDIYTIKVPEGWKARSRMVSNSCVLGLKEPPFTTASPNYVSYIDLDRYKAEREKEGSKAIDNITVNGREYVVFENENKNGSLYLGAATPMEKGTFQVKLSTGAHKLTKEEAKAAITANLKTILENVSFK